MCKRLHACAIAVFYVLCSSVSESEATRQPRVADATAADFQRVREEVNELDPLHLIGAWTEIVTGRERARSPFEVCCILIRLAEFDPGAFDNALRGADGAIVNSFLAVLRGSRLVVCGRSGLRPMQAADIVGRYTAEILTADAVRGVDGRVDQGEWSPIDLALGVVEIIGALSSQRLAEICLTAPVSHYVGTKSDSEPRRFWDGVNKLLGRRYTYEEPIALMCEDGESFADVILRYAPNADPAMRQNVVEATTEGTVKELHASLTESGFVDTHPAWLWFGPAECAKCGRWLDAMDTLGDFTVLRHLGKFLRFLSAVGCAGTPESLNQLLSANAEWLRLFDRTHAARLFASEPTALCRWAVVRDVLDRFVDPELCDRSSVASTVDPIVVAKELGLPAGEVDLLERLVGWLRGGHFNTLVARRVNECQKADASKDASRPVGCLALGQHPLMLDDPNAHFNKTPEDDEAYKAEFGELGPAELKDEELTAFFQASSPARWMNYLKRRFQNNPVKQMNFFAAALAAAQRGQTEGSPTGWWQYAGLAGYTVTGLLWELRHGARYEGSDLGKWFPTSQDDARKILDQLPDLSNAAWRLLRLIVHYGGFHGTERELKFDTLSLMDRDRVVAAYYSAVYNEKGPLLPLPGSNHSRDGKSVATGRLRPVPRHSYHTELISWLCSFEPSAELHYIDFINKAMPPVEDVLYAEGIHPIVVDYWDGSNAEYYDHTHIHDQGRVRSLQFSNYPFLDRLNLDAEGYVNLVEIFVDGVVTDLPKGATDGRVRVIHGVRPCDHCSWMGSLNVPRLREYNPLFQVSNDDRHDVSKLLVAGKVEENDRVWAAYVPVLTAAGYNALLALLRSVPDAQKEDYNRATPSGFTIFPSRHRPGRSVFEQIGQDGRRFDVRASILNEPTVMDVSRGIRDHLSGFAVRNPSEVCLLKLPEVIVSQDVFMQYPLAMPGTRLLLWETLDNRFALDHLAIHLSGDTMSSISDPQSPHFSIKNDAQLRQDFKDALVQFGSSEIMAVPSSFVAVRQQLELSPGVVNCVGFARRIAADAVCSAEAPSVPAVSWGAAFKSASAAGLGLGRKDVFPRALVAFVADEIKKDRTYKLNETGQWWLASQVAVALGSSNYEENEKFGNDVVACIKDESWFTAAYARADSSDR